MVNDTIKYPVYRKYEGNRSFFKITSGTRFTEIQVMGDRYFKHELNAKTLPDFQLIVDMITFHNNHWMESSSDEFEMAFEKHLGVATATV